MREILFKAKRLSDGKWVEGALFDGENHCIIGQIIDFSPYVEGECKIVGYEVDRNTICQYTGLTDNNGSKIWENDIVKSGGNFVIVWDKSLASFCLVKDGWAFKHFFGDVLYPFECEVVGNIFDEGCDYFGEGAERD